MELASAEEGVARVRLALRPELRNPFRTLAGGGVAPRQGAPMIHYRHHIFVCMNARPPGHPKGDCAGKGGRDTMAAFQEEMEKRGLWEKVGLNGCTCLGPCQLGPTVVVYPEGVWDGKVGPAGA